MDHISISRGRIRDAGKRRRRFLMTRCVLLLVAAAVVGAAAASTAEHCVSASSCSSSMSQQHQQQQQRTRRRILQQQQQQNPTFSVTSRIFETRGGARDSTSSSSDNKDNDRRRQRDHRKRSPREDDSSQQKRFEEQQKKQEQTGGKDDDDDDDDDTTAARPEINAQLQQQQQQQQQQRQRHVVHYVVERLIVHFRRFLERSMTRDNLQVWASKAGPMVLALILAMSTTPSSSSGTSTTSTSLSLWNLYAWTLVGSSAGFFLFLYFTSVGYALAIGLPLFVMIRSIPRSSSNSSTSSTPCWHTIMVILWSIRTVAFLLWREFYNWPALHKRIVQVNDDAKTSPDLLVKVLCWFVYSFFYLCMLSPCYYRHKQQQLMSTSLVSTLQTTRQLPSLLQQQQQPRISLWLQVAGLLLESIADVQKSLFKAYPFQRYDWCHVGLWQWSTHPNYLGEWLFWLGTLLGGQVDRPLAATSTSRSGGSSGSSSSTAAINEQLAAAVSSIKNNVGSSSSGIGMSTTTTNNMSNAMKKSLVIPPFLPPDEMPNAAAAAATTAAAAAAGLSSSSSSSPSFLHKVFTMLWSCALQGTGFMFISIILRGAVDSLDRRHLEKYGSTTAASTTTTTTTTSTSPLTSSSTDSDESSSLLSQQDEFMRYRQSIGLWGPKRSWWMAQWQEQRPVVSSWYQTFVADKVTKFLADVESTMINTLNTTAATTTATTPTLNTTTGDEMNKNDQEKSVGGEDEDYDPDSLS